MKNRKIYILITTVLVLIEFIIERYFKVGFIRFYLGDMFAAMLIYTLIKSIKDYHSLKLGIAVLLFTFGVEFLQLIDILTLLDINKNKTTSIVLGHTFSILDLICYFSGVLLIGIVDYYFIEKIK